MGAAIDLVGKQFGNLTVLSFAGKVRDKVGMSRRTWNCLCACGGTSVVATNSLTTGNTKSCGCIRAAKSRLTLLTHGKSKTPEWLALRRVRNRVMNPNDNNFKKYSALGMEELWKTEIEGFLSEMGPMPLDGQRWSVGRIDNDIGYYKGNVRWETDEMQARNHNKQRNNTSGITGVKWMTKNGVRLAAVAQCSLLDGKRITKAFYISMYGSETAFKLACECREKMLQDLNSDGAGYAPKHGL